MARLTIHLDTRYSDNENTYPLCLRIAHKDKTSRIPLGVRLQKAQWNGKTQTISGIPNSKRTQGRIEAKLTMAQLYLDGHQLELPLMSMTQLKTELSIAIKRTPKTKLETIERSKLSQSQESTLVNWGNVLIDRASVSNRVGKASWYKDGIQAFIKFNGGRDIPLVEINEQFLEEFKVYAESEIDGLKRAWKPNTTGVYMRAIRAILNQSIKEKRNFVPADFQPFKTVGIPHETKEVDSITSVDVSKLRALNLELGSDLWKARARFLFMFNCQGMNFVDLAKLRLSDRVERYISYERTKTIRKRKNKRIDVALTKEAIEIWDFFAQGKQSNDLTFDVFDVQEVNNGIRVINERTKSKNPKVTERNRRRRALKKLNNSLKVLSELAGLHKSITSYDARYGWVNAALDAQVSEELIGKGLGHSHPGVTRVYFEERHKHTLVEVELNELITRGQSLS